MFLKGESEKYPEHWAVSVLTQGETDKFDWPLDVDRERRYDLENRALFYEEFLEGKAEWRVEDFCRCLLPPLYFDSVYLTYSPDRAFLDRLLQESAIYNLFLERIAAFELPGNGIKAVKYEGGYVARAVDLMLEAKLLDMLKYMPEKMRILAESLPLVPQRRGTNWKEPNAGQTQGMKTGAPKNDSKSPVKMISRAEVGKLLAKTKSIAMSTASKRVSRAIGSKALKPLRNGLIPEAEALPWIHNSPPVKPRKRDSDYD